MRNQRNDRRGLPHRCAGVLAVVAALSVGACTSAPERPVARPALTWVEGRLDGPLDSDEWVGVIREAEFAYAWAYSIADFSLPELAATWDDSAISSFAATVQSDQLYKTPHVFLGPMPIAALAVEVSSDGTSAVVPVCIGARQIEPPRDDGNRWPRVAYYEVERLEDGTHRVSTTQAPRTPYLLADGSELTDDYCDTITIPRALFDPPPDLEALSDVGLDDVVLPSPTATAEP